MTAAVEPLPGGLDAGQAHRVVAEGVEDAHGVRAAADAGDDLGWETPETFQDLGAGLAADDRLQVADEDGEGRGTGCRADEVVSAAHVGDPVAQGLVHRVLEGARPGLDRAHLGAEQAHADDVELLAHDVLGAHVDDAVQSQQGAGRRRGDAMLAGARLGDHPVLAHAPGEERLAEGVVDLVGAGVAEVLAFEEDGRAHRGAEALGVVQGRRAAGVVGEEARELGLEGRVLARLLPCDRELVERRDERLGDVSAAVSAEAGLDGHG